ncbi:axin-1-like [Uloborus diversus]|uniref:axin-1-like n=1 Tax=Uloborus diversus TaxID=327109 RepID=UPI0024090E09|nr:axin-1-like [Uloborus diversus]
MMNGTLESSTPKSKRSISPRPRTVGEEVKVFHDTSDRCPELYKNCTWNMDEKQESAACEREQQYRPTTPAEDSVFHVHDPVENSSNPSPPPPYKWAQSLICLLEDIQGVNLFQQFLEQEGQDTKSLKFWFACRGVKRADPNDKEGMRKLIKLIFEKKVIKISAISSATKEEIKHKLSTNVGVDDTIFDSAQGEVEAYMMKTTYPNFLRSDIYIQHLGGWQNEPLEKDTVSALEPIDLLPTVHEDSELQISSSNKVLLTRENLLQRHKICSNSRGKLEGPAHLYLKSPYGNYSSYHCKYSSFLPASAQDSELQSLSSDAQTDDTMSLTDSSSIDYSMKNKREQKRQLKAAKQNARENKDTHNTFIPRTQRLPNSKFNDVTSKEARMELLKKLEKVYEQQRASEKIEERLKIFVSNDYSKQEQNSVPNQGMCHKTNAPPVFDDAFFCNASDDNGQDILDQHVSRVWNDSGQHTPACSSPGCISPPTARPPNEPKDRSRVPLRSSSYYEPTTQDLIGAYGAFHKVNQNSQFTVPQSSRPRKDHDTHSKDSCITNDYYSDDSLSICHRGPSSLGSSGPIDSAQSRRFKEQIKRSNVNRKISSMTDSSSSCVDSGISMACKSVVPSTSKVTQWLETNKGTDLDKELSWRNSSTSPVLSRSSRKAVVYNSSRPGTLECGSTPWPMVPSQEMYMSAFPPPETTLIEARRRLEEENRNKMKLKCASNSRNYYDASKTKFSKPCELPEEGYTLRKQSRKSYPATMDGGSASWSDTVTVIGYSYGRCAVPYLSKMPGKNITLRQFKSLLSKKGNFRYFFKKASNDFGTGVVFEEITDDYEVLPLWEGKVFCCIESIDDNSS